MANELLQVETLVRNCQDFQVPYDARRPPGPGHHHSIFRNRWGRWAASLNRRQVS